MNEKEEPKTAGTNLIRQIPLSELVPFNDHPFRIVEDEAMLRITESISEYGVLTPIIARPKDGGYEIISGHRRAYAAKQAGLKEVPVIVKELNDDEATVLMVDSNFQRERILPSERAFAYKMKMEALRHQGERTDLSSAQVAPKLSTEIIAEDAGISKDSVKRYIRLTNLIPDILTLVDEGKIGFTPAVELSYLKPEEQEMFLEAMDYAQASPSLSQAQRMKRFSQQGKLTGDVMEEIMSEEKKPPLDKVILTGEKIRKFFPKSYTPEQMEKVIIKLLETWYRKRMQSHER